jgi:hypothetical protein
MTTPAPIKESEDMPRIPEIQKHEEPPCEPKRECEE